MRSVVLIAALACAASAASGVEAREDRYGPSPDRRTAPLSAADGYVGPVLRWAGKRDAPPPAPTQVAQPLNRPWLKMGAAPPQTVAQPALTAASAPLATAPPSTQVAAPAIGPNMARTYSVGRLYGQQPDPLAPLKPNGMVFIAPSDERAPARNEPPRHGSAEWLAQAPLDADDTAKGEDAKDNTF
ncbi:hypothetical protein [Caulobacter sp.]|uniref:hypothetical protein n=1 Tax=Caulobacter sp. TaxID=78 RepID=UPI003BA9B58B